MANKARILVIENETPAAMMMVNVLTRFECDVLVTSSGKKGLELAQEDKFDFIVLSLDLPDINGLDIASELKQTHLSRRTPIVFISGKPQEEDRRRSQKFGAVDYIVKPFDVSDFVQRILSHIVDGTTSRLAGMVSKNSIA